MILIVVSRLLVGEMRYQRTTFNGSELAYGRFRHFGVMLLLSWGLVRDIATRGGFLSLGVAGVH